MDLGNAGKIILITDLVTGWKPSWTDSMWSTGVYCNHFHSQSGPDGMNIGYPVIRYINYSSAIRKYLPAHVIVMCGRHVVTASEKGKKINKTYVQWSDNKNFEKIMFFSCNLQFVEYTN